MEEVKFNHNKMRGSSQRKFLQIIVISSPILVILIWAYTNILASVKSEAWSPDGEWIVFECKFSYRPHEIYRVRPDGSSLERLTDNNANDGDVSWSPDGQWIIFASGHRDQAIFEMRPDGSERERITGEGVYSTSPSWSVMDEFAFVSGGLRQYDSFGDIYIVKQDGSGQRHLTNSGYIRSVAWSPDGQWLTFVAFRNSRYGIYLIRPDGTDEHLLIDQTSIQVSEDSQPNWSPDSEWIIFESEGQIFKTKSDGSQLEAITPDKPSIPRGYQAELFPSYSPDGQWIVFTKDGTLYKRHLTSNRVEKVVDVPVCSVQKPTWGPPT